MPKLPENNKDCIFYSGNYVILGQVDSVAISCDKLDKCNVIPLIKFDVFVTKSAC